MIYFLGNEFCRARDKIQGKNEPSTMTLDCSCVNDEYKDVPWHICHVFQKVIE